MNKKSICLNTGRTHFKKGHIPWTKGQHLSKEHKKKISESLKGHILGYMRKKISKEDRKKLSIIHLGKKLSEETRRKISNSHKKMKKPWAKPPHFRGKESSHWKGGTTTQNHKIRASIEIELWRTSVFARDNWTCQKYKIKGGKLHAHHILNFSKYPELRFAIDNGITLSDKAHKKFHKKYGVKNNTKEQLEEFLSKTVKKYKGI